MSFLDDVRAKRKSLADTLADDDCGVRDLVVEQLYPDRAHFIYELLQNAEDRGATEARFVLSGDSVYFEHDGESFREKDVLGITNIGRGTKKDQEDQIGRFGIGFKAVFAYSETPHIWSPTFSFKISGLVLPEEIPPRPDLGQKTRFQFPFNSPAKSANTAYTEIEAGLNELAETTLLFLSHLTSISWQIGQRGPSHVVRRQLSENHIEVRKQADGKAAISSHFLVFSNPVAGVVMPRLVSVAFELLLHVAEFDDRKALSQQMRIVPATPGRVAVFFPAKKEVSGLRFHLHAPFVPELSRASIKETAANSPLFEQLADLAAQSLHRIREMGLLTPEFLGVLPNSQDEIPKPYQPVRSRIVMEMKCQPLTPTYSKSHAPAEHLLQAKASLKELLQQKDVAFLAGGNVQWAIAAQQNNSRVDHFLSSLAITQWGIGKFVEHLEQKASDRPRFIEATSQIVNAPDAQFMSWLGAKPLEWHQRMYSLLQREQKEAPIKRLQPLRLVRLGNGKYCIGGNCYFPGNDVGHDELFPQVERSVYLSGSSEIEREESKSFLIAVGVREIGEQQQVEAILKQRYTVQPFRRDMDDIKRFVALVESDKDCAKLFLERSILQGADGIWRSPNQMYVDFSGFETGLTAWFSSAWFSSPANAGRRFPLAAQYAESGVSIESLKKFVEAVGVRTRLKIDGVSCAGNPEWRYLSSVPGHRTGISKDIDFKILRLQEVLSSPTVALAKLVWRTMHDLPTSRLEARYQRNSTGGAHTRPSQLVHDLRNCAWVPQGSGTFVRPSEADRDLLPVDFSYAPGADWIKSIQFGEERQKRSEQTTKKDADAKEAGFPDSETHERGLKFTLLLPLAEQERVLADYQNRHVSKLPENEPINPTLRAQRVAKEAAGAPPRLSEQRSRAVSMGREEVKQSAEEYLRHQYTNDDGEMFCQICQEPRLFKLRDGHYYFETVEFLTDLRMRHDQNYLALCPNHSAMFRFANIARDSMKNLFRKMEGKTLSLELAQKQVSIYFTGTHIFDLNKVIEVDGKVVADDGS